MDDMMHDERLKSGILQHELDNLLARELFIGSIG